MCVLWREGRGALSSNARRERVDKGTVSEEHAESGWVWGEDEEEEEREDGPIDKEGLADTSNTYAAAPGKVERELVGGGGR